MRPKTLVLIALLGLLVWLAGCGGGLFVVGSRPSQADIDLCKANLGPDEGPTVMVAEHDSTIGARRPVRVPGDPQQLQVVLAVVGLAEAQQIRHGSLICSHGSSRDLRPHLF